MRRTGSLARRTVRQCKGAEWRTDPARSGAGGAIGDVGTHAYYLARFVTRHKTKAVSADLTAFFPGHQRDDNVQILPRLQRGAKGKGSALVDDIDSPQDLRVRDGVARAARSAGDDGGETMNAVEMMLRCPFGLAVFAPKSSPLPTPFRSSDEAKSFA